MHLPAVSTEPKSRLADRVMTGRRERFVGRLDEIELFHAGLRAVESPFAVLYVHGPGGVGKTALLHEYARMAAEAGRPVGQLDCRNVDVSPAGLQAALRQAMGLLAVETAANAPDWPVAGVWLIDTYETVAALDAWVRETFLPQLPDRSLVVLAGRNPPAPAWRTELGWIDLARVIALRNLSPEESRTYLAMRGIPDDTHADVLAFTHGHPLALALVADVLGRGERLDPLDPSSQPDVVQILLQQIVRDVPSPAHREALEVCALVWATTQTLLADLVKTGEEHNLFEWLRRQSFIGQGPHGLVPHDLAREVLAADFRWRDPGGHQRLLERLSSHLYARFRGARGIEQQRIWFDLFSLYRRSPVFGPYFEWAALGTAYAEPASPPDHVEILEMVQRHEGDASARIARHWLDRQPEAFLIFRDVAGPVVGFMAQLTLHDATTNDVAADPAVPAALAFVQRHGPVRPGEEVVHLRFWMHRDAYQGVSPAINLTAINGSIHWTSRPRLAWNFVTVADPGFHEPHFTGIHVWRSPDADFEVDGRRYDVFAHDWRIEPATAWMTLKHELASDTSVRPEHPVTPPPSPLLVLSQQEFGEAVRQSLRDYARLDRLATNPLVRSRLVVEAAEEDEPPATTLRALLHAAIETLTTNPKDAKLHRALWHTYVAPTPTQEQAAELLGLPFNTYRYHLTGGIARITAWLWERELGEVDPRAGR
jgi:hypothetical protein